MLIELEGIRKLYRTDAVETTALDDVDLAVAEGELVAVMGPSGGGKSTLMNVIGLIDRPDGGHYRFDGEDLIGYPESKLADIRKRSIGFVFQSFNLIEELTVRENVALPLVYAGGRSAAERRSAVEAVLERVDMVHRAGHYPRQLSGGQQQRVAVARAIVNRPRLILADEPTGNLDTEHGNAVMDMLTALNREGTTIVMVTHSHDCAGYGSRVVRMMDGRLVAGAPQPRPQPAHAG